MSNIWPSVQAVFMPWSVQYEGAIFWMYADILGLITTGIGNLIDPIDRALELPWQHLDGTVATEDEIREAWYAVKNDPAAASKGAGYAKGLTDLRLSEPDVAKLVARRLEENGDALTARFPDFPAWPADAQLATLSMAWAMGAGFKFPNFEAAVQAMDFAAAAAECTIREEGNPGVVARNKADRILFYSAADVINAGGDPSQLTHDYSGLKTPGGDGIKPGSSGRVPWGAIWAAVGMGLLGVAIVTPGTILGPLALLASVIKGGARRLGA